MTNIIACAAAGITILGFYSQRSIERRALFPMTEPAPIIQMVTAQ